MTEDGDLPASPIFAVDGGGIVIFPDVEAAASWMEALEVASGAYHGYDAIGRRCGRLPPAVP